jgi:hypothetical protein
MVLLQNPKAAARAVAAAVKGTQPKLLCVEDW